ncbi:MAG: SDR family NAD(P)-dependent oxidoreductase [Caldilineaceae bacterium]
MNQSTRYAIVTGGNRGIGYETAKALAAQNVHVVIAARNLERGEASAAAIRNSVVNAQVEVMQIDLASPTSVRQFVEQYKARKLPLHILINNAGYIGLDKQLHFTPDGFELEFGTNHLGHFLLTNLLLPVLQASTPARVITVSSIRHMPGKGGKGAKFDFDNLKGEKWYDPRIFYNNTKLANVWFAYELQRQVAGTGITSIAVCPGFVPETFGVTKTGFARWFYSKALMLIPSARTADVSGKELAALALNPEFANSGGKFFANGKEIRSSDESYDETKAKRLWKLSEQLTMPETVVKVS